MLLFLPALAQEAIEPLKTKKAPKIDGILDEKVWQEANKFTGFKTLHPTTGKEPSEKTEALIAYDSENLYVGFKCYDSKPEKIKFGTASDDYRGDDDWIAFCLDSFMDGMYGFCFLVNPENQRTDGTLDEWDGNINVILNLKWRSATVKTKEGWSAEMAIPFKYLPFKWNETVTMRFKIARVISRLGEEVNFPSIDPESHPHFTNFQKIKFSNISKNENVYDELGKELSETVKRKKILGIKLDSLTFEERVKVWQDASVYDYLAFPQKTIKVGENPFHYPERLQNEYISGLFQRYQYSKDRYTDNLEELLRRALTTSFIIIRNDTIIYEKYFLGYNRESIVTSFSTAKSFVNALIGCALEDGSISGKDDPITKYLPELLRRDSCFGNITIKNLLMMSSGLRYNEDAPEHDNDITYLSLNLRKSALEKTFIVDKPDKYFQYNNYNPLLIGLILERGSGKSVTEYLEQKIWKPLGMEYSGTWSMDSKEDNFEKMESGINARAIDMAKFGSLFLHMGKWNGRQIIPAHWTEEITRPEEKSSRYYQNDSWFTEDGHYYKYFWWGDKRPGGRNDFHAVGNKGQYIYISPQKNIVIIRHGIDYGIGSGAWLRLFYEIASKL
jgi:CubicO group peptidase (beta-lactamase class C family)